MRLYIKQKVFSWGDKFTVKDEAGRDKYIVEGEVFSWGKKLHVYDMMGHEVAFIAQELFTWMPRYKVCIGSREVAVVRREFSFFTPKYVIDGLGWEVSGSFWELSYAEPTYSGTTRRQPSASTGEDPAPPGAPAWPALQCLQTLHPAPCCRKGLVSSAHTSI